MPEQAPNPGQGENPDYLPLPDWLDATEDDQLTPRLDDLTVPSAAVTDTQPVLTTDTLPVDEAATGRFELFRKGLVSRAQIALYGIAANIAENDSRAAENREEKIRRKDDFYNFIGDCALDKLIEKPEEPKRVSERGRGVRGRGMNRAGYGDDPGPFMELRYTPEQARRIKKAKTGPRPETIVESAHARKLKRRVVKLERSQKEVRSRRRTHSGVYRPWRTRLNKLRGNDEPVISGGSKQTEVMARYGRRKRKVRRTATQPVSSRWRQFDMDNTREAKWRNHDAASAAREKQAAARQALKDLQS